ncbi:hypothetical protein NS220_02305 [Microbacterium testaceum]|uniref:Uncharacterized protein n=1 Tax=Microbacterium testaceum TaxID=2033 RepID=A0A147F0M5_MICTE|nr:hypothetical protein [Microbacterium testaceum]KTR96367.1 hypothetical protein NS220_02305 [Microbacterium testaceum]
MGRTILLGIDGVLLVELDSPAREYADYRTGRAHAPLPVPADAELLPGGRFFFRPAVVEGLRSLSADLVWNSHRLVDPDALRILSDQLGLGDVVRFPDATELPAAPTNDPVDTGPNILWEHWKVLSLIERLRNLPPGDEVVTVDATLDFSARRLPEGLARRAGRPNASGLGGIKTADVFGLPADAVELLRAWVAGGAVPRV